MYEKDEFKSQHHSLYQEHPPTTQQYTPHPPDPQYPPHPQDPQYPPHPQQQQIHPVLLLQQQGLLQPDYPAYRPVVVKLSHDQSHDVIDCYNSQRSKSLGITQLVCGVTAIVLNVIGIIVNAGGGPEYFSEHYQGVYYHAIYVWRDSNAHYIGTGIWSILFYILCGSFAICAGKKKTRCWITTHLVFAVIGSICAVIMTGSAIWAVSQDSTRLREGFVVQSYGTDHNGRIFHAVESAAKAKSAMYISILFLLTSIGQFMVCVWSVVLCAKVLCCNVTKIHNTVCTTIPSHADHPTYNYKPNIQEGYTQVSLHPYPEDKAKSGLIQPSLDMIQTEQTLKPKISL